MFKLILIAVLITITRLSFAGSFDQFVNGLRDQYFTQFTDRGTELDRHVRVTDFGMIDEWRNPDAIALYKPLLNTIYISENLLHGNDIKSTRMMEDMDVSTIFHEMAHAELDTIVESETFGQDISLMNHYRNVLKPMYKAHYPNLNPHTVFHEHFAYYRNEIIDFFVMELFDTYMQNGTNKDFSVCSLTKDLRERLASGISLEEFKQFFAGKNQDLYKNQIRPEVVYAGSDAIKLSVFPKNIIEQTNLLFWNHTQVAYNFPVRQSDLVVRMNKTRARLPAFQKCREKLWNYWQSTENNTSF